MASWASFGSLVVVLACTDADRSDADAGQDASDDGGTASWPSPPSPPASPAEPLGPAPPVLTDCPPGWREVLGGNGLVTCDPWPESGRADCSEGQAHFIGEPGCAPIGSACPVRDFPEDLPAEREVLYVLSGERDQANGTKGHPFETIRDAIEAAEAGTIIAVGPGTYDESVSLSAGVSLRGSCVARTILTSSSPGEGLGVVTVRGADTEVRDIQIRGSQRAGLWLRARASLSLHGVLITDTELFGICVEPGAELEAQSVAVTDIRARLEDRVGRGLYVEAATAHVVRGLFERSRDMGVSVVGPDASLSLEDVVIAETSGRPVDLAFGQGLHVENGATATVTRSEVARNHQVGIIAGLEGASVVLEDVVIRDTEPQRSDQRFGRGIEVQGGAAASVRRAWLVGNHDVAAFVGNPGSHLVLDDVVVQGRIDGEGKGGLAVEDGASAEARRIVFSRVSHVAIHVAQAGSSLRLEDVSVAGTELSGLTAGAALNVQQGAQATVARALFEFNRDIAIRVSGAGTALQIEDVAVVDTQSIGDGTAGRGFQVAQGARATVSRAVFDRNREIAIVASDPGTDLELSDLTVRDTRSTEASGELGRGLQVQEGAQVRLTRGSFKSNREGGIWVAAGGAGLRLEDVTIEDTVAQDSDGTRGQGLSVLRGANVQGLRVRLSRNASIGILVDGDGSSLRLEDVAIHDTTSRPSDRRFGRGLDVQLGGAAEVYRAELTRNRDSAIYVGGPGSVLRIEDVLVQETLHEEDSGLFGRGLAVEQGAMAEVARAVFDRSREVGVFVGIDGATASLEDVIVRDTLSRECVADRCAEAPAGFGVGVYRDGVLDMTRFVVTRSAVCGIQIDSGAAADLHDGEVSDNPIGACIQAAGYDVDRLSDGVRYRNNGQSLDSTSLPVPAPQTGLPSD